MRLLVWLAGLGVLLAAGCAPIGDRLPDRRDPGDARPGEVRPEEGRPMDLVGRWTKETASACSAIYPDEVEFAARGTYAGRKGDAGQDFTLWDAGGYQVEGGDRLTVETANDAQITYEIALEDDTLTVTDANGCVFAYRRSG